MRNLLKIALFSVIGLGVAAPTVVIAKESKKDKKEDKMEKKDKKDKKEDKKEKKDKMEDKKDDAK